MPASSSCPKCAGLLVKDHENYCLNCGYRQFHFERPKPSSSPRTSKNASAPVQPDLVSPLPDQHVQPVEESCVQAAHKTLRQLRSPFTYKFGGEGLLREAIVPCFFLSPEFQEATKGLFEPGNSENEGWIERWEKLRKVIVSLPAEMRGPVWILLRRCDSRMREAAKSCDVEVQLFLDIITRERQRIHTLRTAAHQTTLFTFSLNDSLLRYCDSVQERLDQAAVLVEEARKRLEPAKTFFLSQRSRTRQEVKRKLLQIFQKIPDCDRRKRPIWPPTF